MSRYYDRDGNQIDLEEWSRIYTPENQRVAATNIGESYISTVWLGINHQWEPTGPPLFFETMIFDGPLDGECWRYSTLDQAQQGHEAACLKVIETRAV